MVTLENCNENGINRSTPFTVKSPEHLLAGDTVKLFVSVFSDFPKIPYPNHVFILGPRGSGKSMIFRYMEPDCQMLENKCQLGGLPYLAFYIGVRNSILHLTELARLEEKKNASSILNEHFMVVFIASIIYKKLEEITKDITDSYLDQTKEYCTKVYQSLKDYGFKGKGLDVQNLKTVSSCFEELSKQFILLYKSTIRYIRSLAFPRGDIPYKGLLLGYLDFLYPLIGELRALSFMPNKPIYLLIDDADNLNFAQTRILNTWVSTRTGSDVSLKVSISPYKYKTFYTIQGSLIESPHDFSEANLQTIYTTHTTKGRYNDRIREIVTKRLENFQIHRTPEEFFPEDEKQEIRIKEIAEEYRKKWKTEGRGNRPSDDALRYARPDFIKSLGGSSKSTYSYSYAGFKQLVHISSGIVRYFLEYASQMYSEVQADPSTGDSIITQIPPEIQNKIVRERASDFLFKELEAKEIEKSEEAPSPVLISKLTNLVQVLGGTFRRILYSDRSERRVFSIALSNSPNDEVKEVLRLGVELGYFHQSTIGNKEGTGRTPLYVMNRRLAPVFSLDPTSFAGYLFVTNEELHRAIQNPKALLRKNEFHNEMFEQPVLFDI